MLPRNARVVFSTQWPFGEEPLTGSSGAQSHCALPGLLRLCSGWIAALSTMKHNLAVSVIMMVVAGFFTLCAVLSLFLLKRVSEWWVLGQLQTQGSPSPWGRHLSPAFFMGDVHHYSSCVSWVLRAPAASSKALGGRSDRLGSVVAALGP